MIQRVKINQLLQPFLWFTLLLLSTAAHAVDPVALPDTREEINLGPKALLLEDKQGNLTLQDVLTQQVAKRFKPHTRQTPNFGFTNSAYWAKVTIVSQSTQRKDWFLEIDYPLLDEVQVYALGGDSETSPPLKTWKVGDQQPFANRPLEHVNFVFPLSVAPRQSLTLLIRVKSEGTVQFPLALWSNRAFVKHTNQHTLGLGLYFGIMLVMMLYNSFIYLSVRDVSYLYYVLYIVFFSLAMLCVNGLAYQYLWPNSTWWANRGLQFCLAFYSIWMLLFSCRFLRIENHSKPLYYVYQVMIGLSVLLVVATLTLSPAITIPLVVAVQQIQVLLIVLSSIASVRRGYRPARFFLFAWIGLMVGGTLRALLAQGWVPNVFITEYGVQIGSALEVILLSLALADRINLLQKQANEKDLLARQNAEKANQAKSLFIANVSHEIRTPLNAVLGYAQMLERDTKLDEKQQHSVSVISKSGEHLLGVINDILDISKIEADAMALVNQDFELVDLVEGIGVMFAGRCEEKRLDWQLNTQCQRSIAVHGDQSKLRQVLINLLGNATKFTHQGSLSLNLSLTGPDRYYFEVIDSGPGIDAQYHDQVFEAFGQTSEGAKHGGTGLGLAIARKQVELMGGKLALASEKGRGCRFYFTLPLPPAKKAVKPRNNRQTQTVKLAPGVAVHALVVDDIKDNRLILKHMLEAVGIKVCEAENGLDALNKLHQALPLPELVFMDIRMQIMDGVKTLRHIHRDFHDNCPSVVVVTAHAMQADVERYLNEGFDHYIAKPFRIEAIYECIHHLLDVEFEYLDETSADE